MEKVRLEQKALEASKPVVNKPEPAVTPKRNFQEEMNNIYKNSQDGKPKKVHNRPDFNQYTTYNEARYTANKQ